VNTETFTQPVDTGYMAASYAGQGMPVDGIWPPLSSTVPKNVCQVSSIQPSRKGTAAMSGAGFAQLPNLLRHQKHRQLPRRPHHCRLPWSGTRSTCACAT
jgi:hypothetical protein